MANNSLNRRDVLAGVGSTAFIASSPLVVSAKEEYPPIEDSKYSDESVKDLAIELLDSTTRSKQPNHDRMAFSTSVFTGTVELFIAAGVTKAEQTPDKIYQVTSESRTGALNLDWRKGNRLKFWRDGDIYELKIPQSNKAFEPTVIGSRPVPSDVQLEGGE